MVIADQSPQGVFDEKCIQLAAWHNVAVDAPKTGKIVPASEWMNVSDFPDHMCRASASNTYQSQKVLGKLYRMADEQVTLVRSLRARPRGAGDSLDADLIVPGFEKHLSQALADRDAFGEALSSLMTQYGLNDEYEAVLGDVWFENKAERREWQGLRDGIEAILKDLCATFRHRFFSGVEELPDQQMEKASAWYIATYDSRFRSINLPTMNFPWIVCDILCAIKERSLKTKAEL
jgi:hypothetical protein